MNRPLSRMRAIGLIAVAVVGIAQQNLAAAVTGPYDSADIYRFSIPDLTGGGQVETSAAADVSGSISAAVETTSAGPGAVAEYATVAYGAGGTKARAYGRIIHSLPASAGARNLTVNFGNLVRSTQVTGPGAVNVYFVSTGSSAGIRAGVTVYYYPCTTGSCSYTAFSRSASVTSDGSLSLSVPFSASSNGRIVVYAALTAESLASGGGSAKASISGVVSSIDLL